MQFSQLPPRESDQRVFVADIKKAKELIEWSPKVGKREGITKMIEWVESND
jgi:CDP-paratose 2-epimerase